MSIRMSITVVPIICIQKVQSFLTGRPKPCWWEDGYCMCEQCWGRCKPLLFWENGLPVFQGQHYQRTHCGFSFQTPNVKPSDTKLAALAMGPGGAVPLHSCSGWLPHWWVGRLTTTPAFNFSDHRLAIGDQQSEVVKILQSNCYSVSTLPAVNYQKGMSPSVWWRKLLNYKLAVTITSVCLCICG